MKNTLIETWLWVHRVRKIQKCNINTNKLDLYKYLKSSLHKSIKLQNSISKV